MVFSICKCKFMVFGFHHYARSLLNNEIKLVLYYGMTILVALVTLYTVEHWKWYQKIIYGEIKLRD